MIGMSGSWWKLKRLPGFSHQQRDRLKCEVSLILWRGKQIFHYFRDTVYKLPSLQWSLQTTWTAADNFSTTLRPWDSNRWNRAITCPKWDTNTVTFSEGNATLFSWVSRTASRNIITVMRLVDLSQLMIYPVRIEMPPARCCQNNESPVTLIHARWQLLEVMF